MFKRILYFLVALITTCTIVIFASNLLGVLQIEYSKAQSYVLSPTDAIKNYNDNSVSHLVNYYNGTNTLISPLAWQFAMYDYISETGNENSLVFKPFKNGLVNFTYSSDILKNRAVQLFSVGKPSSNFIVADIDSHVAEKFVLDEVNATIKTKSDGVVQKRLTQKQLSSYNLFSMCIIDEELLSDVYTYADDKLVVTGNFNHVYKAGVSYTEIPLSNNYTLILYKGLYSNLNNNLLLELSTDEIAVVIPILELEVVGNPYGVLNNTEYSKLFQSYSDLKHIYSINHLRVHFNSIDKEYTGTVSEDYSINSIFIIRDDLDGKYIMLGSIV